MNGVILKIEQGAEKLKEAVGKKLADGDFDGVVDGIEAIGIAGASKFLLGKIPGLSLVSGPAAEFVTTHVQEVTNAALGKLGVALEGAGAAPATTVSAPGQAAAPGQSGNTIADIEALVKAKVEAAVKAAGL